MLVKVSFVYTQLHIQTLSRYHSIAQVTRQPDTDRLLFLAEVSLEGEK